MMIIRMYVIKILMIVMSDITPKGRKTITSIKYIQIGHDTLKQRIYITK